jgi:hypothetical protein
VPAAATAHPTHATLDPRTPTRAHHHSNITTTTTTTTTTTNRQNTLIIGADYYESDEQRAKVLAKGGVPLGVGAGTTIKNCIVDKNARIGRNVRIENQEGVVSVGLRPWPPRPGAGAPLRACAHGVRASGGRARVRSAPAHTLHCRPHLASATPRKRVEITPKTPQEDADHQDKGYMIRSGIVVIMRNAEVKDGTVI